MDLGLVRPSFLGTGENGWWWRAGRGWVGLMPRKRYGLSGPGGMCQGKLWWWHAASIAYLKFYSQNPNSALPWLLAQAGLQYNITTILPQLLPGSPSTPSTHSLPGNFLVKLGPAKTKSFMLCYAIKHCTYSGHKAVTILPIQTRTYPLFRSNGTVETN